MLSGCFGGTVAQQIARSMLMQGADQAAAAAMDAHLLKQKIAAQTLKLPQNTEFDDYQIAFLRSGFENVKTQIETLPTATAEEPKSLAVSIEQTRLVSVEVWNLLAGQEKLQLLENARLKGSELIPPKSEWSNWFIAVGGSDDPGNSTITFLIPPNIGKVASGSKAIVELSNNGELNIARYALN
ncbi:MAG: hypothetical protein CVU29_07355 [Betaproteobacteria bacterium HGW-Betaproteobacteria-22]|nr:MAG: hypothetical protein CVU29_07355 [Betaproteobacteria bacterium HGW-Betaproteobacteria-22]